MPTQSNRPRLSSSLLRSLTGSLLLAAAAAPVLATVYDAGTSGDWTTNATWNPVIAGGPLSTDDVTVTIGDPSEWTVDLAGANRTINAFTFSGTGKATFTGVDTLSVTQNLVLSGAGTLVLDSNVNVSGTMSKTQGPLTIGAGKTVTTTGTVTLNGTVNGTGTISSNSGFTLATGNYSANLSGTGAVSITASGAVVTLSGNNTYSGGTVLNSTIDRININSSGAIGTGSINLRKFDNTSGTAVVLSTNNAITVPSDMVFYGSNDLDFGTGTVTYAPSTTRTLTLNGTGRTLTWGGLFDMAVNADRTFIVNDAGTGNKLVLGGIKIGSGSNRTLTLDGSGTIQVNGAIVNGASGNKLTKSGTGTLILNGASTYTGATTINGGTVFVNGSLNASSAVALNAATLAGTGSVGGTVTTAGVSSVINADSLSLGALNAAAGTTFNFDLGLTSDLVSVTGAFTGSSTTGGLAFNFLNGGGMAGNHVYTLLTFGSSSGLSYDDILTSSIVAGFTLDTSFGTDGYNITSNELQVRFLSTAMVPEPSVWGLMLGGLSLLGVVARRQRRA